MTYATFTPLAATRDVKWRVSVRPVELDAIIARANVIQASGLRPAAVHCGMGLFRELIAYLFAEPTTVPVFRCDEMEIVGEERLPARLWAIGATCDS